LKKIAVTGTKGRLGSWLGNHGYARLRCDITKPDQIEQAIEEVEPDVIINCAAWTAVDDAEEGKNYDEVIEVNLRGPFNLRQAFDGLLVQISTGFVFRGDDGPNSEGDVCAPVNLYGWSKYGGEQTAQMREPTLVVRVLDLFGPQEKTDFVRQVRDVVGLGAEMTLPDNLYGTPTYIPHLAEALLEAIGRDLTGVIHFAGDLTLSRFEWGRTIAEAFGHDPTLISPTSEIKGSAPRPLRGGLNVDKAKKMKLPIYSPVDGLAALNELEQLSGDEP